MNNIGFGNIGIGEAKFENTSGLFEWKKYFNYLSKKRYVNNLITD